MMPHKIERCDHCEIDVVVCGSCGNNTCNGGSGEVMGPEPYTTMKCPDCDSAHEMFTQLLLLLPKM